MMSKATYGFNKLFTDGLNAPPTPTKQPIFAGQHTAQSTRLNRHEYQDDQLVEKALLEESFIEHGLLAVDKSVSIFGEILNLSEGRDKIFKLFSGVLKITRHFVDGYMTPSDLRTDLLDRISSASSATSTARLFLKLFTDWVFFRLAIRVYHKQRWGTLKILTMGRLLGLGLYFTFQLPIFLHTTKMSRSINKRFWSKLSLYSYIISSVCQLSMDLRKLVDLTKEIGYWQMLPNPFGLNPHLLSPRQQTPSKAPSHPLRNAVTNNPGQKPTNNSNPAASTDNAVSDPVRERSHAVTMRYHALLRKSQKQQEQLRLLDSMIDHPPTLNHSSDAMGLAPPTLTVALPTSPAQPNDLLPSSFASPLNPILPTRSDISGGEQLTEPASDGLSPSPMPLTHTHNGHSPSALLPPTLLPPIFFPNPIHLDVAGRSRSAQHSTGDRPSIVSINPQRQKQHPASYLSDIYNHTVVLNEATNKERLLQKDRNNLLLNFVKDGGDLWGAFNGAFDLGHSDLFVGCLSLVSGSIALYRLWSRYKSTIEQKISEKKIIRRKQKQRELMEMITIAGLNDIQNQLHINQLQQQQQQQRPSSPPVPRSTHTSSSAGVSHLGQSGGSQSQERHLSPYGTPTIIPNASSRANHATPSTLEVAQEILQMRKAQRTPPVEPSTEPQHQSKSVVSHPPLDDDDEEDELSTAFSEDSS